MAVENRVEDRMLKLIDSISSKKTPYNDIKVLRKESKLPRKTVIEVEAEHVKAAKEALIEKGIPFSARVV